MVFAPGGDGGCPHQPVSVVVGTAVFYSDCVYCEAFGSQVFGIGVIRGRIQTKLGQMSWTVISVSTWRLMVMLVVLISSHNRWHCSWLSGIWELRGRKARDSRLATNDRSRDVMNYLERLILARGRH